MYPFCTLAPSGESTTSAPYLLKHGYYIKCQRHLFARSGDEARQAIIGRSPERPPQIAETAPTDEQTAEAAFREFQAQHQDAIFSDPPPPPDE